MTSVWFQSFDPVIAGDDQMRPLSLGSMEAMRVMGVTWLDRDVQLDLAQEERQILLFDWLHRAPLPDVEHALWSGAWQVVSADPGEVPNIIIARYRLLRDRLMSEIDEAKITIRPRESDRKAERDTPADVMRPRALDYRVWLLMRDLHLSRTEALWHLPLVQALTCYHCSLWNQGLWTVKPGAPVKEADFEDFDLPGDIDMPEKP